MQVKIDLGGQGLLIAPKSSNKNGYYLKGNKGANIMCYTLIDKLEKAVNTTDIATVGYQTLFSVLANGGSDAKNYAGTKAEADAIVNGTTVKVSDGGSNPVVLDKQYIKARTQAGTKVAYLEIVLTKPYIATIELPQNLTRTVDLLTLPSNSKA